MKTESNLPLLSEMHKLNPPPATPLSLPHRKQMEKYEGRRAAGRNATVLPLETYVSNYLRQNDTRLSNPDETMQRLTKLMEPDRGQTVDAYSFALRQLTAARDSPGVSEDESAKAVRAALDEEDRRERHTSRRRRRVIEDETSRNGAPLAGQMSQEEMAAASEEEEEDSSSTAGSLPGIPSILHSRPRTISQMTLFSSWLHSVPYSRWTIGAMTSLDHWIATEILGLSEETWARLLKGDETAGISRTRDIVAVREALFPETTQGWDDVPSAEDDDDEEEMMEAEGRIDKLLRDLSADDDEEDDLWGADEEEEGGGIMSEEEKREQRNDEFLEELQVWRQKRQDEGDYAFWSVEDREKYDTWQTDYLNFLTPPYQRVSINATATREALLSPSPISRSQNNQLWTHLSDETDAEIFLDQIIQHYKAEMNDTDAADAISPALRAFLNLPYEQQVKRLVTIGTLRVLYDEYVTEKEFDKFFEDYGEVLLQGVPVEYIVRDDVHGTITGQHLRQSGKAHFVTKEDDDGDDKDDADAKKYKIDVAPYDSTEERQRQILKAFGEFKAIRAEYEEDALKKRNLGLVYTSPSDNSEEKTDDTTDKKE